MSAEFPKGGEGSLPIPKTIPTIAPLPSRVPDVGWEALELVGALLLLLLVSIGTMVPSDAVKVGRGASLS